MKECDIVQDLLFGYNDKTLKDGSKEFVENHLKECEKCKKIYEEIKDDKEEIDNIEIDYLKKINKKGKKKNLIIIILSILVVIAVLISIVAFINYFNKAGIEIFLEDNITDNQIEDIKEIIIEIDRNAKITYKSKQDSLEEMKNKLDNANLLDGYEGENNIFPASLVVKSYKINKLERIENSVQGMSGIKSITRMLINPYELLFAEIYFKYFYSPSEVEVITYENTNEIN